MIGRTRVGVLVLSSLLGGCFAGGASFETSGEPPAAEVPETASGVVAPHPKSEIAVRVNGQEPLLKEHMIGRATGPMPGGDEELVTDVANEPIR